MPRLRSAQGSAAPRSRNQGAYDSRWRRRSRRAIAEHVARHGMVCPGLEEIGHAPHPVTGVGGDKLTGDHPIPIALGGSPDQEPRVLCQAANTMRGVAARADVAALEGYPARRISRPPAPPGRGRRTGFSSVRVPDADREPFA